MESEEGKEDFKGYDVSYGEILVFSGPNLLHGNQTNEEKDTRCSIDFRIYILIILKHQIKVVLLNVKFKVGGYFEKVMSKLISGYWWAWREVEAGKKSAQTLRKFYPDADLFFNVDYEGDVEGYTKVGEELGATVT